MYKRMKHYLRKRFFGGPKHGQTSLTRTPNNQNPRYLKQNCYERMPPNALHPSGYFYFIQQ